MKRAELERFATEVVDAAFQVHGPGLLESVYVYALAKEFELRNIEYRSQVPVELFYKGATTGKKIVMDLVIEKNIVVEAKSCEVLHPVCKAQLLSYMKLAKINLGFLINFHVPVIKQGINRLALDLPPY